MRIPVSGLTQANLHCVHATWSKAWIKLGSGSHSSSSWQFLHRPSQHNSSISPLPLLQHSSLGHVRRYSCNVTAVRAGFHYYAFQQILLFRYFFSEMTVLAITAAVHSKNITTFSLFTSQKWSLGMMWVRTKVLNGWRRKMMHQGIMMYLIDIQGPEKINDTSWKTVPRGTWDSDFTVIVSPRICHSNWDICLCAVIMEKKPGLSVHIDSIPVSPHHCNRRCPTCPKMPSGAFCTSVLNLFLWGIL
jgi:hypothetical protein